MARAKMDPPVWAVTTTEGYWEVLLTEEMFNKYAMTLIENGAEEVPFALVRVVKKGKVIKGKMSVKYEGKKKGVEGDA